MNVHLAGHLLIWAVIASFSPSANAKSHIAAESKINSAVAKFDPTGLHAKARIYSADSFHGNVGRLENSVEVWYYPQACVFLRTPPLGDKSVSVLWYAGSAPDGDAPIQQWGNHVSRLSLPIDYSTVVGEMAPLWFLHEISISERKIAIPVSSSQSQMESLVAVGQTGKIPGVAKCRTDWHCLIQDDRIVSATKYFYSEPLMTTKNSKSLVKTEYVPCRTLKINKFDNEQSTIPREIYKYSMPSVENPSKTMVIDSVESIAIPTKTLLEKITLGLPRAYGWNKGRTYAFKDIQLRTLDGDEANLDKLMKSKTTVLDLYESDYTDSSWEAMDEGLDRIKLLYQKYKSGNDVEILSIAFDTDVDRVRAYVRKHHIDWPTLIVPPAKRTKLAQLMHLENAMPSVALFSDKGEFKSSSPNDIYRIPDKSNPNETLFPSQAESLINYARKARKVGSYAKVYLGDDVVRIMEKCDTIFIYELESQDLEEMYEERELEKHERKFRSVPQPVPGRPTPVILYPPPGEDAESTDTIDRDNWRGKIKDRLGNFAWKEKRQVSISRKTEVLNAFFDGTNMKGFEGDESYPGAKYGIEFRAGKESARLAFDSDYMIQVFKSQDSGATQILLTKEGGKRLEMLFKSFWVKARLVRKAEVLGPQGPLR